MFPTRTKSDGWFKIRAYAIIMTAFWLMYFHNAWYRHRMQTNMHVTGTLQEVLISTIPVIVPLAFVAWRKIVDRIVR